MGYMAYIFETGQRLEGRVRLYRGRCDDSVTYSIGMIDVGREGTGRG
jgi:hypothetical protein